MWPTGHAYEQQNALKTLLSSERGDHNNSVLQRFILVGALSLCTDARVFTVLAWKQRALCIYPALY